MNQTQHTIYVLLACIMSLSANEWQLPEGYLLAHITNGLSTQLAIKDRDNGLVGHIEYGFRSNLRGHGHIWVSRLEIVSEARRQGFGSLLLQHVIAQAAQHGLETKLMAVPTDSGLLTFALKQQAFENLAKFYEKNGGTLTEMRGSCSANFTFKLKSGHAAYENDN